ncbi:unnamed protein product [Leptidea sinapis]|uniref:Uncharacterized protein n=1 Tax=Leptidea sinapis TaxID=189913 RepID=A0A5E4Q3Q2_9NEOP|nr:unnamed protein product [Leptidea sinapis]
MVLHYCHNYNSNIAPVGVGDAFPRFVPGCVVQRDRSLSGLHSSTVPPADNHLLLPRSFLHVLVYCCGVSCNG